MKRIVVRGDFLRLSHVTHYLSVYFPPRAISTLHVYDRFQGQPCVRVGEEQRFHWKGSVAGGRDVPDQGGCCLLYTSPSPRD